MDPSHPLFDEYKKTLPKKIEKIKSLISQYVEKPALDPLDQLRKEVHKIAGSSGTYGYMEASKLCQKLEQELIPILKNFHHSKPKKGWEQSLEKFPNELEKAFTVHVSGKSSSAPTPKKRDKKTIIVVDDDEDLLNLLKYEFKQLGFEVDPFKTGQQALSFLMTEENLKDVFLIVLDRMLPDMDGLEILQKFNKKYAGKIPVLIISVLDKEKDILEGLETGAVDYLTKPFSVFMLVQKSLNLLRTQK